MQLLRSVGGRSTGVGFACAVVHAPACAREISRRRSEGGCASLLFTCLRIRRNASTEIEHVDPSICTHGHAAGRFVCWAVADGPVRSGVRSLGRTHPTVYAGVRARVPCRAFAGPAGGVDVARTHTRALPLSRPGALDVCDGSIYLSSSQHHFVDNNAWRDQGMNIRLPLVDREV
jgi:hypothetical protein